MTFKPYTHIERLGTTEVNGLLDGRCYVFPKIDGTNASLWCVEETIQAGSRNRHLSPDADNAGFLAYAMQDESIQAFFQLYSRYRLFGEWLVPHSLKTYNEKAWRKFYVFDVMLDDRFLSYDEYKPMLDTAGIEYIPPIFVVENPTEERLFGAIEQNNYLIKDGEGVGEGVVIKNYNFVNRFGRTSWAKIVSAEFKAKHTKEMGVREVKEKTGVEERIACEFVTKSLVEKVFAKIELDNGGFSSKDIPRLLHTVYYDVVREDIWEIVKKHKNPVIDFGMLQRTVNAHTKIYKPEIFGVRSAA